MSPDRPSIGCPTGVILLLKVLRVSAKDVTLWLQETRELVKELAPKAVVVWVRLSTAVPPCGSQAPMSLLFTPLLLSSKPRDHVSIVERTSS